MTSDTKADPETARPAARVWPAQVQGARRGPRGWGHYCVGANSGVAQRMDEGLNSPVQLRC